MSVRAEQGPDRLPRLLFIGALALAGALLGLVVLAPWLDAGLAHPRGLARAVAAFARDGTLRRTSLASAAGLTVVAFVFFRSAPAPRSRATAAPSRPTTPPVVGA